MPKARRRLVLVLGKSVSAARQTSQLKAEVFIVSARIAAGIGSIVMPRFGRAKKNSSSSVTSGVARNMLT